MGFFKKKSESFTSNPNTGKNCCTTGDSVDGFTSIVIDLTDVDVNVLRNIGTTPIEILPAPGVGKYYEFEGVVEYTHVSAEYNFNDVVGILGITTYAGIYIIPSTALWTTNKVIQFSSKSPSYVDGLITDTVLSIGSNLNEQIVLTTYNANNATLGDAKLKIKLKYKVLTFG